MRYRRYEISRDLPGSKTVIRTGPIGMVWFGVQGIVLTILILFWPLLIGCYYDVYYGHDWWIWFVVAPGQVCWSWALYGSIKRSRSKKAR